MFLKGELIMNTETAKLLEVVAMVAQSNEIYNTFHFHGNITNDKLVNKVKHIDFKKVDPDVANYLGFYIFNDEFANKHLMLVPLWLFNYLPMDMKMISIHGNEVIRENADDEIPYGCVRYMIEVGSEFKDEYKN